MNESLDSKARILVVDDDASLQRLYGNLLADYQIDSCINVKDALSILERQQDFAALLVDLMLPDESGTDLFEKICNRWPDLRNRIIFVTGIVPNREIGEILTTIKNPLLLKPFTSEALQEIVRKTVQGESGPNYSTFSPEAADRPRSLDAKPALLLQEMVLGLLIPGFLHRLNNALTGGLCHVQLLMEESFEKQFVSDAFESLKKAVESIVLLEDLARLQSDKPRMFALHDCITQAASLITFLPRYRNVRLSKEYSEDSLLVWENPGVLMSLIMILLADAEIPIEQKSPELSIRIESGKKSFAKLSFESQNLTFRDPRILARGSNSQTNMAALYESALSSLFQVELSFYQEQTPGNWRGFAFHFAKQKEIDR